jgi:uncharacterized membrane protein YphA (DoxX/SURF4 family)
MTASAGGILLAGRILFALFFVNAAVSHVQNDKMMRGYARQAGFPIPFLAGWPVGIWLGAGAVSVALGIWADLGSLMLGAFLVPAALFFHNFWKLDDPTQRQTQKGNFTRNVALLGASLALFAFFAVIGDGLRFAVTSSLFSLR